MLSRCRNLGQGQPAVTPRHHVTRRSDVNLRQIAPAFHRLRLVHVEELGVQRTSVELKSKLGDFRSNRQHDDESPSVLQIMIERKSMNVLHYKRILKR